MENILSSHVRRDDPPQENYTQPPFPSLFWPPQNSKVSLKELDDIWKFTLYWTLILYGLFHLGAVGVAVLMQVGKRRSTWKYLWVVPLIYALIAGFEAVMAGSVVGLMSVYLARGWFSIRSANADLECRVGAGYLAGGFTMSTWVPFVWGWVNVLVLIVASFRIQGGL